MDVETLRNEVRRVQRLAMNLIKTILLISILMMIAFALIHPEFVAFIIGVMVFPIFCLFVVRSELLALCDESEGPDQ